jgi:outer membrane lipopolysaccharide assembly protein LptE/RlpB
LVKNESADCAFVSPYEACGFHLRNWLQATLFRRVSN